MVEQRPQIREATSIAPSDTSTSTVLPAPLEPQIAVRGVDIAEHLDLPFAQRAGGELRLDLKVPAGPGRKPLVVYVTGGGFVFVDKANGLRLRTALAEAGFAVASIEYRSVLTGATYADGVADVRDAVAFLRANADKYGFDGDSVGLLGESAGGYLVTMAGLDPATGVRAVVNKFGAVDFATIAEDFDAETQAALDGAGHPLALYLHGPGTGRTVHDKVLDASPLSHITADAPPFQIWHGSADGIISPSQTLTLHNALRAAGVDSSRYVLDGATHGDVAVLLGRPDEALPWYTEQVIGLTVEFLREHLG
ncbi:alpha/beta hydrolase [Kutzneria buriramensis]|uniref:Acetyl esterase/lipase n=1 Tax=Kutzneria buriramensis TaxID=1045776 RepID=A0A3E0HJ13_9PSEU|nr:alpha/beta hydrolase [Kutzneria buriramensis]REH46330.1 acetyl esterase/lipase [Kutzneria buriramensis]